MKQELQTEPSTARLGQGAKKDEYKVVRKRYRADMLAISTNNKKRIEVNLEYAKKCAKIFSSTISDLQMAIVGNDLPTLKVIIEKYPERINETIQGFPLIYIAARSGNFIITEYLLSRGCSLNFQKCKSTPMHGAAYFGHQETVKLLIKYGVPKDIKNVYGSIPQKQAGTSRIKDILNSANQSLILNLSQRLAKLSNPYPIISIYDQNRNVIAKKIITNNYFSFCDTKDYVDSFHGTRYENLQSIVKHGLKKPGEQVEDKKIVIPQNHFRDGFAFRQKENWSNAVFSSPSIYYASHGCYSRQIVEDDESWLPVIQLKIKKGSYEASENTVRGYKLKSMEPKNVEFRVENPIEIKRGFFSSETIHNVVVIAVFFVNKKFLKDNDNYYEVTNLVLNSNEQNWFRLGRPSKRSQRNKLS